MYVCRFLYVIISAAVRTPCGALAVSIRDVEPTLYCWAAASSLILDMRERTRPAYNVHRVFEYHFGLKELLDTTQHSAAHFTAWR